MQLKDYIYEQGMSIRGFSRRANLNHRNVETWVRGERIPNVKAIQKIYDFTEGRVTISDFYGANVKHREKKELKDSHEKVE